MPLVFLQKNLSCHLYYNGFKSDVFETFWVELSKVFFFVCDESSKHKSYYMSYQWSSVKNKSFWCKRKNSCTKVTKTVGQQQHHYPTLVLSHVENEVDVPVPLLRIEKTRTMRNYISYFEWSLLHLKIVNWSNLFIFM